MFKTCTKCLPRQNAMIDIEDFNKKVIKKKKEHRRFFVKLKSVSPKKLDQYVHTIHDEVFSCTDCLKCANCCKTTSPIFSDRDISRIAKHLRTKPSILTDKYLKLDEDKEYVLKKTPCTFLGDDNRCSIYDVRPKACREYPHTDRVKQTQILHLTQKNVEVCPAVFKIVDKLKATIK